MRRAGWAALAAGLVAAAALAAAPSKDEKSPAALGVPVSYRFDLDRRREGWPDYDTSMLLVRSARKLRPLYVTGRGSGGEMQVAFKDLGGLESALTTRGAGALLDMATTKEAFTVRLDHWHAPAADAARTAGTDWLARPARPAIVLVGEALTSWGFALGQDKRPLKETYVAVLKGTLAVGDRTRRIEAPVTVRFIYLDSSGKPARMVVAGGLKLAGSDLGLGGDDAGELEVAFSVEGYTTFLEEQPLPVLEELDLPPLQ
jgi:hypothetical protein